MDLNCALLPAPDLGRVLAALTDAELAVIHDKIAPVTRLRGGGFIDLAAVLELGVVRELGRRELKAARQRASLAMLDIDVEAARRAKVEDAEDAVPTWAEVCADPEAHPAWPEWPR